MAEVKKYEMIEQNPESIRQLAPDQLKRSLLSIKMMYVDESGYLIPMLVSEVE